MKMDGSAHFDVRTSTLLERDPVTIRTAPDSRTTALSSDPWDRLALSAHSDNIFTQPWFQRAGQRHCPGAIVPEQIGVADSTGMILGYASIVRETRFGRLPLPHWQTWDHPNQFLGLPMVRRGREQQFWNELLNTADAAADSANIFALSLPMMAADSPITKALVDLCQDTGRPLSVLQSHSRAALHSVPGMPDPVPLKRTKRLRNLQSRLVREHGPAAYDWLEPGQDCREWIEAFLALEQMGWKGSGGTSLNSCPKTSELFTEIIHAAHTRGLLRFVRLRVSGRTVAMNCYFVDRNRAWGFKQAFNPAFSTYAPGFQLLRQITVRETSRSEPLLFDSCSSPKQASVNSMWPDRIGIQHLAIGVGGSMRQTAFKAATGLRAGLHRLRGWRS